jgi:hypothetical protein
MSFLRRIVPTAVAALCLASCGGGTSGTSPAPAAPAKVSQAVAHTGTASAGTLYFSDISHVYAYALDANVTGPAARTITLDPNNHNQLLAQIATGADGSLGVLDRNFVGPNNAQVEYCRVYVLAADANGTPSTQPTPCDSTHSSQAAGIARNTQGGFDTLTRDNLTGYYALHRLGAGGTLLNGMPIRSAGWTGFASDRGGHDYFSNSAGQIIMHKASTTDPRVPQQDFTLSGSPFTWALGVSPGADRTLYVVTGAFKNQSIIALAPGATTASRTIGPFTAQYIEQIAVNSQGELYVSMNDVNGTTNSYVSVYSSTASGAATPVRTITPDASIFIREIRGMAIAE